MSRNPPERTDEPLRAGQPPRSSATAFSRTADVGRADFAAALALTGCILCFHVLRWLKAGGLWRDEAATAHLAATFSLKQAIDNSRHELFPALFPAIGHGYSLIAGGGDLALRFLGLLVGVAVLAALWWNQWIARRSVPLFSLVLLGFNGVFIQWVSAVRAYGLGILFLLLSAGCVWRVMEKRTPWRMAMAVGCAVLAVQCLFNNAVLLLAVCSGGLAVTLRRGARRESALLLGALGAAAVSLLPYWAPLRSVREWDVLVRWPVGLEGLTSMLSEALGASGGWNVLIWALLFASSLAVCVIGQFRRNPLVAGREQRDLLLFAGTACAVGVAGYYAFLQSAGYPTKPWYYLAMMALVALLMDFIFDTLRPHLWARRARLGIVVVAALGALIPTWRQAEVRQTNVDLVAAKLDQLAAPGDFIIVAPWYNGISFNRYYHGPATWMTVPPVESHAVHRYDLVKDFMVLPDQNEPVRPVLEKIRETLSRGHRVWVAGVLAMPEAGQPVPNLSPAPDKDAGWHDEPYTVMWSAKTAVYLETGARRKEAVPVESTGMINRFEDLPLTRYEGW